MTKSLSMALVSIATLGAFTALMIAEAGWLPACIVIVFGLLSIVFVGSAQ